MRKKSIIFSSLLGTVVIFCIFSINIKTDWNLWRSNMNNFLLMPHLRLEAAPWESHFKTIKKSPKNAYTKKADTPGGAWSNGKAISAHKLSLGTLSYIVNNPEKFANGNTANSTRSRNSMEPRKPNKSTYTFKKAKDNVFQGQGTRWEEGVGVGAGAGAWAGAASPSPQSLCSERASKRGPGQWVVSYSFFGPPTHKRRYLEGIPANAKELPKFFPNWTMRVYHEVSADEEIWMNMKHLERKFQHLDLCNISSLPVVGNFRGHLEMSWRFVPLQDPLVEGMISRDLDSRPSHREAAAVAQWLTSLFSFHVMRDHVYHDRHIMGGMWGARKDLEPEFVRNISSLIIGHPLILIRQHGKKGKDQKILKTVLFPAITGKVLQHDSYYCRKAIYKIRGGMAAFPTRRTNQPYNFVGARYNVDKRPLSTTCPKECRPTEHKNWRLC